jgi:hypothetical protein
MSVPKEPANKRPPRGVDRSPPPLVNARALSVVTAAGLLGAVTYESPRVGGAIAAALAAVLALHKLTGE